MVVRKVAAVKQLVVAQDLLGIAVVSSAAACAVLVFGYGPRRWV